jgi:hypothetical protein
MSLLSLFDKYAPGPLEVLLFVGGICALLAAAGMIASIPIGTIPLLAPRTRTGRIVYCVVGVALLVMSVGLSLRKPVWNPAVSVELIYAGAGTEQADEVVADGDQVYLRTRTGNIYRVLAGGNKSIVDRGTNTKQIVAAGGVLYVLKHSGRVLAVVLADTTAYPEIDPGTDTRQIVATGEGLYILKENGDLWRGWTQFAPGGPRDGEAALARVFTPLGPRFAGTKQIASSGTVLFALKRDGTIHRYFPLPESSSPRTDVMKECGSAKSIAADAGTLYLIDEQHSRAFVCHRGSEMPQREPLDSHVVTHIAANAGVAYVVTNKAEVWRHAADRSARKLWAPGLGESGIRSITAANQGCLIVKQDGTVWRLSESLRKL